MKVLMSIGANQWMPTFYYREFGWKLADVGLIIGTMTLIVAPIALITGGKLSEYWMRRGKQDANLRIVLYGLIALVPISIITPLMPNPWLVLTLQAVTLFLSAIGTGPAIASFQIITPNRMRAQVSSVSQFSTQVIALAIGPLIVALFTDYLFGDANHLKYSLSLCSAVLGPLTILLVFMGLKPYAKAYERAVREGY
jgi:MFS family permease